VREVGISEPSEAASFAACLASILELPLDEVPLPPPGEEVDGWRLLRWLGGLGLGLVPVANAASFSWAGPWIAWAVPQSGGQRRAVVLFGVPSGVVWDPIGAPTGQEWRLEGGFVVAALDVATARPSRPEAPTTVGMIESIWIAERAGAPMRELREVRAIAGQGLEGDRHVSGTGTFPSGRPGSALTLIEAEVCESFSSTLTAEEHRRNVVTRGIDLNRLVGHEFVIGELRCRGVRLNEPCSVLQRYSSRPVLRPLIHRGGLRADILEDGVIRAGDSVGTVSSS
jgi:hypothetical protein